MNEADSFHISEALSCCSSSTLAAITAATSPKWPEVFPSEVGYTANLKEKVFPSELGYTAI